MQARFMLAAALVVVVSALVTGGAAAGSEPEVVLGTRSIDLFHSASVRVSGIAARSAQVRPLGAK